MASTKLTIGTDPELVLSRRGAIIKAGDVIHERDSKFGVDGHPYTAELRPDPAIHPRDLVESIRKTLSSRAEQLANYLWLAGPWALDKPLGGHIHFGVPFEDKFRVALNWRFGALLGMIEPEKEAKQRRTFPFYNGKPYGALGDIREKKWGFEYRTPGSYIVSPGVTLGALAVAKAIIWEEINNGKMAWANLPAEERTALMFTPEHFNECRKDIFLQKIPILQNHLQNMIYFKSGQEGRNLWPTIAYLFNHTIKNRGYRIGHDIKLKWKLIGVEKPEAPMPPPPLVNVPIANWWRNTERVIKRTPPTGQFILHKEDAFDFSVINDPPFLPEPNIIIEPMTPTNAYLLIT